jgi:regulator of replication initiation timing
MNTIEEQINSLNTKLQLLLKKYSVNQKENGILKLEIEKIRKNKNELLDRINALEMQTGILKASAGKMNEDEKNYFQKSINQYIKDLDKCMAMLNN